MVCAIHVPPAVFSPPMPKARGRVPPVLPGAVSRGEPVAPSHPAAPRPCSARPQVHVLPAAWGRRLLRFTLQELKGWGGAEPQGSTPCPGVPSMPGGLHASPRVLPTAIKTSFTWWLDFADVSAKSRLLLLANSSPSWEERSRVNSPGPGPGDPVGMGRPLRGQFLPRL